LGSIDIARSLISMEERGIIAATGYVIGTDTAKWYYIINEPVIMHVGMSEDTIDFKSVAAATFSYRVDVGKFDRVRFTLSGMATLTIKCETHGGIIKFTRVFDISEHIGKTLYPWISTVASDTLAVKIMQSTKDFTINVQDDGKVVMTTSNTDIIDLNLGDIAENSGVGGGGGILSSDKIQNTISGATVEAKDDGGIVHSGGIRFTCNKVSSPTINIALGLGEYSLVVENASTTSVTLPQASTVSDCMQYTISRTFPLQGGEIWQNPALKVYGDASDTIDGEAWIGLPPDTGLSVMSVGVNKWRIL
jgi:hypothetical protein